MGINADAEEYWSENVASYIQITNSYSAKEQFLYDLVEINKKFNLPIPTKQDLKDGCSKKYSELCPTTKLAIKEMILAMGNKKYRDAFNIL
tara:strand:+ start:38175 stop:38447 length:273 start_codon:yes stop_codon:yes gene_type:complete